ncbi:tyrosine-protein phosphatase non-receptor type 23-like [Tubulanus polymorphus]|uniref:tyrosine-protein phosphatase non-receptor type 23-like n=1 Tax=Tubulanus polymorphus TaxID=672921 RepID=UPI003DA2A3D5
MEAVPRMPMISFDLKLSPDAVEFGHSLRQYISEKYGENADHYNEAISEIDSLRTNAVRVSQDFMGCSLLKRYYCQCHLLQNRFPLHDGDPYSISFTWEDIFTGRTVTQTDVRFELASILYNIGALHSVLGALDTRQTPEGMKISCTHFQCAAWAFQHLLDTYQSSYTYHFTREVLTFQINLMLAQAQECILEKSMTDNRKSTITAKVAAQIVEYYRIALDNIESQLNHCKKFKEWKKRMEMKIQFYKCVMYLYMGNQCEEKQRWGERLTYYQSSLDTLENCIKLAKNEGEAVAESLRFTMDVVGGKRNIADRENAMIYHEKVPDINTLPEIKGAALVKGIPFEADDIEISGADIFAKLVPIEVHESSSLYSEEKAKLLRQIGDEIDQKETELAQFLVALKLDRSMLDFGPMKLPEELLEKCAAISVQTDTVQTLIDAMKRLSGISLDVRENIDEIESLVQQEEKNEREFQEIYGKKRAPNIIISEIAQESAKYESVLMKADQSNSGLHKVMEEQVKYLRLLTGPLEELDKYIPSLQTLNSEEDVELIDRIRMLLGKIEQMKTQRTELTEKLRENIRADDITLQLVSSDQSNTEVFQKHLSKHDELRGILSQNLSAQDNILHALTDANAEFAKLRKSSAEIIHQREQAIANLKQAFESKDELLSKASKGIEFYEKLDSNVTRLIQRLKGVLKVQDEERKQILDRLLPKVAPPPRPSAPKPGLTTGITAGLITNPPYDMTFADIPAISTSPAAPAAAPTLKDFLPFMKPKTFGNLKNTQPGQNYQVPPPGGVTIPQSLSNNQSGVQPGIAPGVQPGVTPGVQPGIAPGVQPGVTPGVQPGVQPGVITDSCSRTVDSLHTPIASPGEPTPVPSSDQSQNPLSYPSNYQPPGQQPAVSQQSAPGQQPAASQHPMVSVHQNISNNTNQNYIPRQQPHNHLPASYPSHQGAPHSYPVAQEPQNYTTQGRPQNYTAPHGQTQNYTAPHGQTQNYMAPHGQTQNYSAPHGQTQNYSVPHGQTQNYSAPHGQTQRFPAPQGLIEQGNSENYSTLQGQFQSYPHQGAPQNNPVSQGQPKSYTASQVQPQRFPASHGEQSQRFSTHQGLPQNYNSVQGQLQGYTVPQGQLQGYTVPQGQLQRFPASHGQPQSYSIPQGQQYSYPASLGQPQNITASLGQPQGYIPSQGQSQRFPDPSGQSQNYMAPHGQQQNYTAPQGQSQRFPDPSGQSQNYMAPHGQQQNYTAPQGQSQRFPVPSGQSQNYKAPHGQAQNYKAPQGQLQNYTGPQGQAKTVATQRHMTPYPAPQGQPQNYPPSSNYPASNQQSVSNQSTQQNYKMTTSQQLNYPGQTSSSHGHLRTAQGSVYTGQQNYQQPQQQQSYPQLLQHISQPQQQQQQQQQQQSYHQPPQPISQQPQQQQQQQQQNYHQQPVVSTDKPIVSSSTTTTQISASNQQLQYVPGAQQIPPVSQYGAPVSQYGAATRSPQHQIPRFINQQQQQPANSVTTQQTMSAYPQQQIQQTLPAPVVPPINQSYPSGVYQQTAPVSYQQSQQSIELNRQTSTTSSTDDLLSSSPDLRDVASNASVLTPKVLTEEDLKREKEEKLRNTICSQKSDPLADNLLLDKFVWEVEQFRKHVCNMVHRDEQGGSEFDKIWKELNDEMEVDSRKRTMVISKCYTMKNRQPDIVPYDDSRVILTTQKDDYINASYIDSLAASCPKFIATQSPLPVTYVDFWLMVCEQGSEIIVMLINDAQTNKSKPHVYWPTEKGKSISHGPIQLTLQSIKEKEHSVERLITLTNKETKTSRTLFHLQFTDWNSCTTPTTCHPIIQFISEVHCLYKQQRNLIRPVIVHCSSGVNNTAVFCILYTAIQEINMGNGLINVPDTIRTLRQKRKYMIEDKEQLLFCYEAVLYYAQHVLVKRGVVRKPCEKKPDKSQRSADDTTILGELSSFKDIESTVAKLHVREKPPADGTEQNGHVEGVTVEPIIPESVETPVNRSRSNSGSSSRSAQSLGNQTHSVTSSPQHSVSLFNLPASLASVQNADLFTLQDEGSASGRRTSKSSFTNPTRHVEDKLNPDDPLEQLDPLWSIK